MAPEQGGKRTNHDELTEVSDSGERAQPTHLWRHWRREKGLVAVFPPVRGGFFLFLLMYSGAAHSMTNALPFKEDDDEKKRTCARPGPAFLRITRVIPRLCPTACR